MLERTINDPEAMKLWVEYMLRRANDEDSALSEDIELADAAVDAFMLRFGDEHGRREWEEFKQAQKAGNAP